MTNSFLGLVLNVKVPLALATYLLGRTVRAMSKNTFSASTAEQRAEWARRVKSLREAAGLTQDELAQEAKTSRQTVNNMETGMTPQLGTLKRVLNVLGVNTDDVVFDVETDVWLTTMGTLIELIPELNRRKHVDIAIGDLAAGVREGKNREVIDINDGGRRKGRHIPNSAVATTMKEGPEEYE